MTARDANSRKAKLIVVAALVGLVVLILLLNVDGRAVQAACPVGALIGAALQAIPCVLMQGGLQALQASLFDHQAYLQDFRQMLVSFWLLLWLVVGTGFIRSGFTSKSEVSSTPSKDF
jgi:hypothetical protein